MRLKKKAAPLYWWPVVARDGNLLGGLGIADRVRADAAAMIDKLRKNGIERAMMLTGDTENALHGLLQMK